MPFEGGNTMKETYIQQVKQELSLPKKKKEAIARDLREAFACALEHGETEQQVIERLGSPAEFARSVQEQLGTNPARGQKWRNWLSVALPLVAGIALLLLGIAPRLNPGPPNAIGQANAQTLIQVRGPAIDPHTLFLALACLCFLATGLVLARRLHRKHKGV